MPQPEYAEEVAKSIMMSRYNQQYSEIDKIPSNDLLFFLRLVEAEEIYTKKKLDDLEADMERLKNKARSR